ncbi:MAG: hypothetical protein Q8M20_08705 [Rhodocyclaceae bacterium]|nr:hypothetical protein [Rhodocyclaceae bacterium]MDZ4215745.1 hypothetical protein [Rhodocyclaceae bacterium]
MPLRSGHRLANMLAAATAAYQAAAINPHCGKCTKPCCRLDPLVLELDWQQLKGIWQLDESHRAFDRRLAAGKGPQEIRTRDGIYYAHRKVCPAYDEARHTCRVYNQNIKPPGCTDFPVYTDQDCVIADLRCEAVDLAALTDWLVRSLEKDLRIVPSADAEFPFLVSLSVTRP